MGGLICTETEYPMDNNKLPMLLTRAIRATELGRKRMAKRTNEREYEQARAGSGKMDKDKDDDRDKTRLREGTRNTRMRMQVEF